MKKLFNATTIAWVAIHLVLVLVGLLIINIERIGDELGQEISNGIGLSILSAGIVGLFLFLHVLVSEGTRAKLKALNDAGLDAIYNYRSVRMKAEYDSRLSKAKKISVIGYGLGSLLDDYPKDFPKWSAQAKVRILAVNPVAPSKEKSFADIRDKEEGREPGRTRNDVDRLSKTYLDTKEIDKNNFEVRLMNSIPSVNVMIVDSEIFWGPYLMSQQSRNTFTMTVHKGGFLYDSLANHFEEVWKNHSTPLPKTEVTAKHS